MSRPSRRASSARSRRRAMMIPEWGRPASSQLRCGRSKSTRLWVRGALPASVAKVELFLVRSAELPGVSGGRDREAPSPQHRREHDRDVFVAVKWWEAGGQTSGRVSGCTTSSGIWFCSMYRSISAWWLA
jgi:hypothetical protein